VSVTDAPSSPPSDETSDLAQALAALERAQSAAGEPIKRLALWPPLIPGSTSTRRARRVRVLGGLLLGGVIVALALAVGDANYGLMRDDPHPQADGQATVVFNNARSGDCLTWPNNKPNQPAFVDCKDDHLFEVAESVDMRHFQEPCALAVRGYLGTRYDPNSKFTSAVLWSGDAAGTQPGERHLLCGLQLPGSDNQPIAFKGQVAALDQSKVWRAGTCLGIDSAGQPTELPVDCSAPHAVEVTGAINLAEKFPGERPAEPEQDAFIRDACTRTTDAYLSPIALLTTPLTLIYSAVSLPSWLAGSHQVSCGIGATNGDRGWATLTGTAKGRLLINGQTPVAPPNVPAPQQNPPPTALAAPPTALAAPPTDLAAPTSVADRPAPEPPLAMASGPPPAVAPVGQSPAPVGPPAVAPVGPGPPAAPSPPPAAQGPAQEASSGAGAPPVIEIPGLPPITLPVLPPPPAPPPAG
jgi:predicted heme/steroid binding protein